jgi:CDP-diacylglycerol--glycerol-3-phosphate 3-phosphatidyltransferase
VSSAIRTVPNAVTLLRLLLMPVCAYLLATGRYGWGLALTAVVGSTDWVDGWLARRTGQVSRVGQLLDPLADRLLIASVAVALVVRGVLPWPAAVLLLARDLLLLAGWPLLKRRGIEPPEVVFIGKAATLVLLVALPVLTLGATGLAVAGVAHLLGLALLWVGVAMYYLAGAVYVRMVLERLGHRAGAGPPAEPAEPDRPGSRASATVPGPAPDGRRRRRGAKETRNQIPMATNVWSSRPRGPGTPVRHPDARGWRGGRR